MTKTTKTKVPIRSEVIPIRVKLAEFKKVQADLAKQQQTSTVMEERIRALEGVVTP